MSRVGAFAAVTGVALAAALSGTSCLALLCYEDETCAEGGGGAPSTTTDGTGVSTSNNASAAPATASGMGGAGGSECGDTLSTPENCGACEHDCAGAPCVQGVCGTVSLDLEPTNVAVGPISVRDEVVLVPVPGGACGSGVACMFSVPVDATDGSAALPIAPVADVLGLWGRGAVRNHYAPQTTSAPAYLYSCDVGNCVVTVHNLSTHINGSAEVGGRLYLLQSGVPNMHSIELDGNATPTIGSVRFEVDGMERIDEGPHLMFAQPPGGFLVWSTYGEQGCLYRENVANLMMGTANSVTAPCRPNPFLNGAGPFSLAVDPNGAVFSLLANADGAPGSVYQLVDGDQLVQLGRTQVRAPIAVDELYLYARSQSDAPDDGLVVIRRSNGELVTKVTDVAVASIDATHPDYVFFTQNSASAGTDNNLLFRWRKLPN